MKKLGKVIRLFGENFFKIFFLFFFCLILYFIVILLTPFFQIFNFFSDIFISITDLYEEIQKYINEYNWEEFEIPKKKDDVV
tara:strand:+ start:109 stop:354 length:246 start_codon:yes stop_codon:yes gene_type:complete